jgi:transcriptional regulator with AAA-type ATPase domain
MRLAGRDAVRRAVADEAGVLGDVALLRPDSLGWVVRTQALERTKWNKKQAATLLGLNRTTLVEMLKRKRINPRAA